MNFKKRPNHLKTDIVAEKLENRVMLSGSQPVQDAETSAESESPASFQLPQDTTAEEMELLSVFTKKSQSSRNL